MIRRFVTGVFLLAFLAALTVGAQFAVNLTKVIATGAGVGAAAIVSSIPAVVDGAQFATRGGDGLLGDLLEERPKPAPSSSPATARR